MPERQKTIADRLLAVAADASRIGKHGVNTFQNYAYVTDSDVVDAVREALAKQGLFVAMHVRHDRVKIYREEGRLCAEVYVDAIIHCPETGEQFPGGAPGYAEDKGDKAAYKAITGAKKYALLLLLGLSTGDDPENDRSEAKPSVPHKAPIDRDQLFAATREKLEKLANTFPAAMVQGLLTDRYNADGLTSLTIDELNDFGKYLKSLGSGPKAVPR